MIVYFISTLEQAGRDGEVNFYMVNTLPVKYNKGVVTSWTCDFNLRVALTKHRAVLCTSVNS